MPPRGRRRRSIHGRRSAHANLVRRQRSNQNQRTGNVSRQQVRTNRPTIQSDADIIFMNNFISSIQSYSYHKCGNCNQLHFVQQKPNYVCSQCMKNPHKFSAVNNMQPGDMPSELKDLTHIEQMLIARVQPVLRIYQLRAYGSPGQFRYSGNILNVVQDVIPLAMTLPHTPESLSIILVRRQGATGFKDFRVRRAKVLAALSWLTTNNPLYADVIIDQHEIQNLPADSDISERLRFLEEGGHSVETTDHDRVTEDSLPIVQHQRQETSLTNTIMWPQANSNPINEFRDSGYIPRAFPHLFPYGLCAYLDNTRNTKVTFKEWCNHLLRYSDQRFAQDPRFRFFCLNTMMRHDACQQGTVFVKLNDYNGTVDGLKTKIQSDPQFIKKLLFWSAKIRGTSLFVCHVQCCRSLVAMPDKTFWA